MERTDPDGYIATCQALAKADQTEATRTIRLPPVEAPPPRPKNPDTLFAKDPPMTNLTDTGMATHRLVLGKAHVDRAEAAKSDLDAPFQALITDDAWGHVWSKPSTLKRF